MCGSSSPARSADEFGLQEWTEAEEREERNYEIMQRISACLSVISGNTSDVHCRHGRHFVEYPPSALVSIQIPQSQTLLCLKYCCWEQTASCWLTRFSHMGHPLLAILSKLSRGTICLHYLKHTLPTIWPSRSRSFIVIHGQQIYLGLPYPRCTCIVLFLPPTHLLGWAGGAGRQHRRASYVMRVLHLLLSPYVNTAYPSTWLNWCSRLATPASLIFHAGFCMHLLLSTYVYTAYPST